MYNTGNRRKDYQDNRSTHPCLKVFVKAEVTTVLVLILRFIRTGFFLVRARHDTSLLVIANSFLEEIGLASQRDGFHEVKWVGRVVELLVSESQQESICHELDVLLHEGSVHAKQGARKSVSQEFLLNGDGFGDHVLYSLLAGAVFDVREEEASEVSMETLVARNELVGESQAGH